MIIVSILIYAASFVGLYIVIFFLATFFENRRHLYRPLLQSNYPSVAFLVPCYNEEKTIAKTIKSLLSLNYPKEKLSILIIDDGSRDDSYQIARQLQKKNPIIQVYHKENGGKYTALNHGLEQTKAEFIATLDADSVVDSEVLKIMIPYFSDPNTKAVTSSIKIYQPKGLLRHVQNIEYILGIALRKVQSFLGSINVTPGPMTIFRREVFAEIGNYRLGHNTEDFEMALRMQKHNFQIENAINAYVYTVAPNRLGVLYRQRKRWYQGILRNGWDYRSLFGKKHGNLGLFILPATLLGIIFLLVSSSYFLFRLVKMSLTSFSSWRAIGFDLSQIDPTWPSWFFVNSRALTIISVFSILLTLILLFITKRISSSSSKFNRGLILTALFYFPVYTACWFGAVYTVLFNRKTDWAKEKEKDLK